ncbi:MAG: pyruvate kinase [Acidaminococcus sp.]|jgi:pyruvate kinase|nr:pyruvate kinase [Acidaminococcus sp.]MCI2100654.1 pyruvate kinase [Acidaminococcus sp.]MCI2114975.1 pyruvate kinase [Acidaminococcus sp.]MCI2117006.1 pyruvate kinase [Acidaminococcus sp.]
MKKTKIICTLGPATDKKEILVDLINKGMDLARFNFSHGTHEECAKRISLLREAAKETGRIIGLIGDTKGPEMRLGVFKDDKVTLVPGQKFTLTTEEIEGTAEKSYVNYKELPKDIHEGDMILLNDGKQTLHVDKLTDTEIYTTVVSGGEISSRKRVAVPGAILKLPFMSEADISDITFAAEQGMDYIAASFVRNADDVMQIKRLLEDLHSSIGIIAKIENQEGVDNIDSIINVADGIMIARGDLGVEIPMEDVPVVQKEIIAKCNAAGKPVVTATQMLESMITNYRATRAEANDVANSIYDGTDVIMLSGETASGAYPREAVETMARIAVRTEQALDYINLFEHKGLTERIQTTDAISHATVQIATELDADVILSLTESGYTARMVAKYRPHAKVVAVSSIPETLRRVTLYWGVTPLYGPAKSTSDKTIEASLEAAESAGLVKKGDSVVVTAGKNVGKVGSTNLIQVINVAQKVVSGLGIGKKSISGPVCKIRTKEDLKKLKPGMIIVVSALENEMGAVASQASGIIAEEGGFTSAAAIVGINCGIPVVVGAAGAMDKLNEGDVVTLDVEAGCVYAGKINIK